MNKKTPFLLMLLLLASVSASQAAQLRFHESCQATGPLVLLGDLAEVLASSDEETEVLAAIELFPAPSGNGKKFVRVREIQEALARRGVNLASHQLTGSSVVEVSAVVDATERTITRGVNGVLARQAERAAIAAITKYLNEQAQASSAWQVAFQLSDDQVRALTATDRDITVSGGKAPWLGEQRFELLVRSAQESMPLEIQAKVSLPDMVVVATRSLPKGTLIRDTDVCLQPLLRDLGVGETFATLEDVLGQETTRSITSEQPLAPEMLTAPILIRRGDAVTVTARAGGLKVKTTGRARDAGGLGDVITVESLLNRDTFLARVSGPQQVEIFAHSTQVELQPAAATARPSRLKPSSVSAR